MKKTHKSAWATKFEAMLQRFMSTTQTAQSTDIPSTEPELDEYSIYDDTACDVCAQEHPNWEFGIEYSNVEICDIICNCLDIDYFDLFDDLDPQAALESDNPDIVQGHAFLYFLRFQVFAVAKHEEIGDQEFNQTVMAHSELWFIKLTDRWKELMDGTPPDTTWMN